MSSTTLDKEREIENKKIYASGVLEVLSIQQLIDLSIDIPEDQITLDVRYELIKRGMDNIQNRILIKKLCKSTKSRIEDLIKNSEEEKDKNSLKIYKNKFLNSVSIIDKLQLEWQKHDIRVKY